MVKNSAYDTIVSGAGLSIRWVARFSSGRYKEAMAVATTDLVVTHPIRLGLALNFSVFHYEVLGNPEEACKMARQAFEDAIAELDSVSEDSYKVRALGAEKLQAVARGGIHAAIRDLSCCFPAGS